MGVGTAVETVNMDSIWRQIEKMITQQLWDKNMDCTGLVDEIGDISIGIEIQIELKGSWKMPDNLYAVWAVRLYVPGPNLPWNLKSRRSSLHSRYNDGNFSHLFLYFDLYIDLYIGLDIDLSP